MIQNVIRMGDQTRLHDMKVLPEEKMSGFLHGVVYSLLDDIYLLDTVACGGMNESDAAAQLHTAINSLRYLAACINFQLDDLDKVRDSEIFTDLV